MTAQAREILNYEGGKIGMACEPFSQYIIKNNLQTIINKRKKCKKCNKHIKNL